MEVIPMPFRSDRQRRYMWARHPRIARRWAQKYGSTPRPKRKSGSRRRRRKG